MILSGKEVADSLQIELRQAIAQVGLRAPGLAVILIGDHTASHLYVSVKQKACAKVGIESYLYRFPASISESELIAAIESLNQDNTVDGILVQMPLPEHIRSRQVFEAIAPEKDVDGFHPINMGKVLLGDEGGFVPCTPLGIKVLLEKCRIDTLGKHVVIVGRSNIVGKPLAALLMQKKPGCNATVTVLHSQTENMEALTLQADILVAAIGVPQFIKGHMVREGATVIDVGIHRLANKESGSPQIVGDVDFDEVLPKCAAITPVPKGVGPMTVAMLLENTWKSYQSRIDFFHN